MTRGRRRKGQIIDGILLLDKPADISSNFALQLAKRLLDAQKAGHTGSLDPIATGLLPLCFGKATKVSELLLGSDKTYEVEIVLGVETDTGDIEGQTIDTKPVQADQGEIESVLDQFRGTFDQIPPMHSALKKDGQPLYKLARQGITIDRPARTVTVNSLTILNYQPPHLTLQVNCSKGFYIRSLAHDIGKLLNTGGHVNKLRRTRVGDFSISQAITMPQLECVDSTSDRQNLIIPIDQALLHLPELDLSHQSARDLCHGRTARTILQHEFGLTRIYDESKTFIGLAEVTDDGAVIPRKIFM